MRLRKPDLTRRVNGEISIKFTESGLTSYAGIELLTRYLRRTKLNELIRRHFVKASLKGDYSSVSMIRLVAGMLIAGGRRLQHVDFLRVDPAFLRFCHLTRLPTARTLSRWLKNFKAVTLESLYALNADIVARVVRFLDLRTITVKRRDILRVDRRVLLRVGDDAVISIDGHDIRATTGGITSKKYIQTMQKVASYPLLFSKTRRKNGCHNRGFRLMMLILS